MAVTARRNKCFPAIQLFAASILPVASNTACSVGLSFETFIPVTRKLILLVLKFNIIM